MMMSRFAMFFGGSGNGRDDRQGSNPFALIATIILAPIAAMLIQAAISRSREFDADAGGAAIAGGPNGLVSALRKIEVASKTDPARRESGDGAHVHHQAVQCVRSARTLQHASADRAIGSRRFYSRDKTAEARTNCGRIATVEYWRTVCCLCFLRTEDTVHVEDLDISPSKIAETAQRIIDRAIEEARRREHALLTNEHLFLAFAQVEWDMFAEVMRDVDLNPHTILQAIEEHLHMMPSFAGRDLRVSPATKLVFKLALHHASRAGRQTIEARRPVFRRVRGNAGRAGVDSPTARCRAGGAGVAADRADARHGAARRAAEEALRAAAVPEALRDQPEPARAPGQAAAGVRPRQGDPAGAGNPLPPRARQLGDADRRARRRQDGDRRRAGAADRVRARDACRSACATARSSTCR